MGWRQVVVTAAQVIIFGTANDTGLFVYNGVPSAANPPIAYITSASKDPFGNATTPDSITSQAAGGVVAQLLNGQLLLSGQSPAPNTLASIGAVLEELAIAAPMTNASDVQGFLLLRTALSGNLPQHQINGSLYTTATDGSDQESLHAMILQNSWTAGAGGPAPQYQLLASPPNCVEVIGRLTAPAGIAANQVIWNMPTGYVPANTQSIIARNVTTDAVVMLRVNSAGEIDYQSGAVATNTIDFHSIYNLVA